MLIGIIILTTGQAWALTTGSTTTQRVFTSIKELRDAAQTNSLKHDDVVVKFDDSNPTTVVAVMKHADPDIKADKFVNSFFIIKVVIIIIMVYGFRLMVFTTNNYFLLGI